MWAWTRARDPKTMDELQAERIKNLTKELNLAIVEAKKRNILISLYAHADAVEVFIRKRL